MKIAGENKAAREAEYQTKTEPLSGVGNERKSRLISDVFDAGKTG